MPRGRSELAQPRGGGARLDQLEIGARVETLPTFLALSGAVRAAVTEAFERMAADATSIGDVRVINSLLRSQFDALVTRLHLAHSIATPVVRVDPLVLERFRDFRISIERESGGGTVAPYAAHLGCLVKTLNRATLDVADLTAKTFVVNRIVLEAKRLLAHSVLPVSTISTQLGFDEATNFVNRETGSTPGRSAFNSPRPDQSAHEGFTTSALPPPRRTGSAMASSRLWPRI